jgi:hypothetical protein
MSSPTPSGSLAELVFGSLRVAVVRELESPEVARLLRELVVRGWRPRQLADRVGAQPVEPTSARDAEVARREQDREQASREAPVVAAPEERARWIEAIRSGLKGSRTRAAFGPPVRLRPDCALCSAESQFFVRRDVHLCKRCVDLLAAGEVRPETATGT